jgi:hypothetical protein
VVQSVSALRDAPVMLNAKLKRNVVAMDVEELASEQY